MPDSLHRGTVHTSQSENVSADEHTRENYKEKNQKLT